jgi:hemerythrin
MKPFHIAWEPRFSVGIEAMDKQHKKLVEIINRFMEAKVDGKCNQVLKETLTELVDYTNYHFSDEEKLMMEYNYPRFKEHQGEHKALVKRLIEVLEHMKAGKKYANDELFLLLKNWLLKHVLDHDQRYGEFIAEKGKK